MPPRVPDRDPLVLEAPLLERLLSPADPALQVRVLTDLLDRPADDPDVVAARARVCEQPFIRATLAAVNDDGTWGSGFYDKYRGTSWVLLHLSELGAPMHLPVIQAGVQNLLAQARPVARLGGARGAPFRDLADGVYWEYPVVCLNANMALVLIRAGLPGHAVTRAALNVCRHRFEPGEGFGCMAVEDSLLPACVMSVPKVLKALLALPHAYRSAGDDDLIEGMVAVLQRFRLYQYVPREAGAWRNWASTVTTAERRAAKPQWIAAGRLEPRRPKDGWLRFGFPHSYNSDLLEVLLLLGEAGASRTDGVEAGLALLRARRGADGMWPLLAGLNGKLHADLDGTGASSPWITYRALLALKRFGALALAN